MATSMASLSRRFYRSLLSNPRHSSSGWITKALFSTDPSSPDFTQFSSPGSSSDSDPSESESELSVSSSSSVSSTPALSSDPSDSSEATQRRPLRDRVLEDGVDVGIYRAVIVGRIGQSPLKKTLKNGMVLTLTTVGTGGMRNERKPFSDEEPREYADRTAVQWHRVAVYNQGLGSVVMKHAQPGALVYLEGNLETKIFTDPISGLVKRIREVAIRRNGRIVFLGDNCDYKPPEAEIRSVGYY